MFTFRSVFAGALSVGAVWLSGSPLIQAQTLEPQQLATRLQEAICLNEWDAAIWATNQLIGHPAMPPQNRQLPATGKVC